MGTNYYDPGLFNAAENSLGISVGFNGRNKYINIPATTYAAYKSKVNEIYGNLSPLEKLLCDYHMSALTEVVSSGVTTDPDYWSGGSNGNYIINSGLTTSKVGINTIVPNHELSVSGSVSASSVVYGTTLEGTIYGGAF